VFLDLPSPWEALEHAKNAFKTDEIGRICCFSPSMEQVQLTCTKLHELGFAGINLLNKKFECLNAWKGSMMFGVFLFFISHQGKSLLD
jgi:tRNA (adenine57-N1/adenine58-N1)-methyltransferase